MIISTSPFATIRADECEYGNDKGNSTDHGI